MPETVSIMGIPYTVKLVDVVDKNQLCFGEIDYFACEIRIDKTLTPEMQKVTLLHEILHGCCNLLGLNDVNENESAIQGLASGLYSALKGASIFS